MGMHTILVCDVKGLDRLARESKRKYAANISAFFDGANVESKADAGRTALENMAREIDKIRNKERAQ